MKRTREFYIWLIIMQIVIAVLWWLSEIGLYGKTTQSIEDTFIWLWYIPIIMKSYDIGYRQRGWDMGYDD